ncbi:MAG: HNH endonuclease [Bdellovibrionaceae bacterium]|nr:HNH endonuclease [Pseudobdellovibrionaceae bacterium]MBX3034714.1 HNH endonuclease [Pseudobdellovibrionaceae bacterium]
MHSFRTLIVCVLCLVPAAVMAQNLAAVPAANLGMPGQLFYQVKDSPKLSEINTLDWMRFNRPPPQPSVPYNRKQHYGPWILRPHTGTCFNTRGLILKRESQKPTTVYPRDPCFVETGLWHDPYSDRPYTAAIQLQIDHVVPLKNSYISGAFRWNNLTRCAYANFMAGRHHLVPVDAGLNMSKGDSAPHAWMPPNRRFHCAYLAAWMEIKTVWKLMISEPEGEAIQQMVRQLNCSPAAFRVPARTIAEQRARIPEAVRECAEAPPPVYERAFSD